ncbi:hypothetical protein vBBcePLY3_00010 [Bacillus phage vB_BceP_LY3]|uniref:Uncharacterized protein n=1 Tax=Bacillus phage vB_BceP_LY3 TaxID=2950458 RepID=A0AAE9LV50_9CAUD|nr:hypothetical protein vBBcePLY3_00010 [Bacillus phage vB_BceP_LY3]
MKRQVRVMMKEHNRLKKIFYKQGRFLSYNKPKTYFKIFCLYMNIKIELKKWGYNKCGL